MNSSDLPSSIPKGSRVLQRRVMEQWTYKYTDSNSDIKYDTVTLESVDRIGVREKNVKTKIIRKTYDSLQEAIAGKKIDDQQTAPLNNGWNSLGKEKEIIEDVPRKPNDNGLNSKPYPNQISTEERKRPDFGQPSWPEDIRTVPLHPRPAHVDERREHQSQPRPSNDRENSPQFDSTRSGSIRFSPAPYPEQIPPVTKQTIPDSVYKTPPQGTFAEQNEFPGLIPQGRRSSSYSPDPKLQEEFRRKSSAQKDIPEDSRQRAISIMDQILREERMSVRPDRLPSKQEDNPIDEQPNVTDKRPSRPRNLSELDDKKPEQRRWSQSNPDPEKPYSGRDSLREPDGQQNIPDNRRKQSKKDSLKPSPDLSAKAKPVQDRRKQSKKESLKPSPDLSAKAKPVQDKGSKRQRKEKPEAPRKSEVKGRRETAHSDTSSAEDDDGTTSSEDDRSSESTEDEDAGETPEDEPDISPEEESESSEEGSEVKLLPKVMSEPKPNNGGRRESNKNKPSEKESKPPEPKGKRDSASFEDFSREVLDAHNVYRERHKASPLKLSPELTRFSQNWAKTIAEMNKMQHSKGSGYGENIYYKSGGSITGRDPVDAWYNECKLHTYGTNYFNPATGHFTQLVWKGSQMIGVGMAKSSSGAIYVVVNYFPPGNIQTKFKNNVLPP